MSDSRRVRLLVFVGIIDGNNKVETSHTESGLSDDVVWQVQSCRISLHEIELNGTI